MIGVTISLLKNDLNITEEHLESVLRGSFPISKQAAHNAVKSLETQLSSIVDESLATYVLSCPHVNLFEIDLANLQNNYICINSIELL